VIGTFAGVNSGIVTKTQLVKNDKKWIDKKRGAAKNQQRRGKAVKTSTAGKFIGSTIRWIKNEVKGEEGEDKDKKLICTPSEVELERLRSGRHRSSFGLCLYGQPAVIFRVRFKGVAPMRTGTMRKTTVKIIIFDFMIFLTLRFFLLSNKSKSYTKVKCNEVTIA
jgi:hypothetical protein